MKVVLDALGRERHICLKWIEKMTVETEALTALLDALEAGIVQARNILAGPAETWNPDNIRWINSNGAKGQYQRSEDIDNPDHKALVKELAGHNRKLTRNGFFYWLSQNGIYRI